MPSWDDRFPFLNTAGREQLKRRFMACLPAVQQAFGWTSEQAAGLRPLGCGNYGCTFMIPGAPKDRAVVKVTTDNLEAHVVALLMSWGEEKPDGIVKFNGIWQLGRCSVLPRMRTFEYTKYAGPSYDRRKEKTYYRGPGAPFRPVWVISREEAPDAWATLQARGLKKRDLAFALDRLRTWAHARAVDWGAPGGNTHFVRISDDDIRSVVRPLGGENLLEALDWLMERGIGFYDFTKVANLGWREGTGLVIRDIGFASTELDMDLDDLPKPIGTLPCR